jgi:MarC family membrane protein
MTIITAAVLIFMVMDPFGNIPFFVCILQDVPRERRLHVLVRELFIALLVLFVFLFVGPSFMKALQISEASLRIAGGIILFLIAIKMVFGQAAEFMKGNMDGEPFIVPLAIPSIAGPSAMATLMLLAGQAPGSVMKWSLSLLLAWGCAAVILVFSEKVAGVLGKKALGAVERLMGLVLTAISVEMFIQGLHSVFV